MIIGGTKETSYRQFRVNPNAMSVEVLDDLPFPFDYGSCHEYNEDFAVACAGADNKEHCWELSGATDQWTQHRKTQWQWPVDPVPAPVPSARAHGRPLVTTRSWRPGHDALTVRGHLQLPGQRRFMQAHRR